MASGAESTLTKIPLADQFQIGLDLRFHFIFPIPSQVEVVPTPLFGFTLDVFDLIKTLYTVLRLPAHPLEITEKRSKIIAFRMAGASYIMLPIPLIAFDYLTIDSRSPLVCFITNRSTHSAISTYRQTVPHPTLQISSEPSSETVQVSDVRLGHFCKHFESVRTFFSTAGESETLSSLNRVTLRKRQWNAKRLSLTKFKHLSVLPNHLLLESFGFKFRSEGCFPSNSNEPYIRAIGESAQAIKNVRDNIWPSGLPNPPTTTLILTVPSFYKHLYSKFRLPKNDLHNSIKFIKALTRANNYFLSGKIEEILPLIKDPLTKATLGACRKEIEAYSLCVAAKAANSFAPVLRLPPSLNHLHGQMARIAGNARGNSPHVRFKQNKLMRELKIQLRDLVPNQFFPMIDGGLHPIKLICDVPLEWLPIRGLPLMLRADVSRIPTTPGNLLFEQCISVGSTVINPEFLKRILIIRSFMAQDPVGFCLPIALETAKIQNLNIRIANVTSAEGIIEELCAFQGGVVIFDCHGSPATACKPGQIIINGKGLDIWSLRGKFHLPPIVFLSSCDTHSIDGTSDSIANSFLLLGAKTVIGSALPLMAKDAAVFLARLLYRLSEYVPLITSTLDRSIRWVSIMAGMQRMVYLSEVLSFLRVEQILAISASEEFSLLTEANMGVSAGRPSWFEEALKLFASAAKLPLEHLSLAIEERFNAPESIKYLQLGNPEDILIPSRSLSTMIHENKTFG